MGKKGDFSHCTKCYTLNPIERKFCAKCGSALEAAQETLSYGEFSKIPLEELTHFEPGQIFDNRYRIIEEIGRGGMGIVYKAEDTVLKITVALKIIRPEYSSNPFFIEQFKKETLMARSISHENVIRIHDLGETGNIKYISMEFIKGQNLKDLIQSSGYLSVETAINLTCQICEALRPAHQKGIVHQDLKPSNVMIDNAGKSYVMDFGLARSFFQFEGDVSKGISGTPQYMSPEQAQRGSIDQRTDIYSLGIMMYEMLTGKQPFEARSMEEYMRKHIGEAPIPPSKINPRIPARLEFIILKCLEKEKTKRFQKAEEILDELNEFLKTRQAEFFTRLKKYWYMLPGIVMLLILAGLIYIWKSSPLPSLGEGKRISLAVMYMKNNSGDKELDFISRTFAELLIADLLQSKYIRVITGTQLYDILSELNLLNNEIYTTGDLQQIAIKGSADFVLEGQFTKAGETLRINTILNDAKTMEPIGREAVEGRGNDSIFFMVDRLSQLIKRDFGLSQKEIYADIDKDVMSITTHSSEALQLYIDGMREYHLGKFKESIDLMMKAIIKDPEFAMAYLTIYLNLNYLGRPEEAQDYLAKARALTHRVTEREYYLIQGIGEAPEKAIENYNKILELYPDDLTALGLIGALYRNMEEWDPALEHFKKLVEVDDNQSTAHENIAYIYMAKGDYKKAREILEAKQDIFANPTYFHVRRGMCFLLEGNFDLALRDAALIQETDPGNFLGSELEGLIHFISGDFVAAESTFQKMIDDSDMYTQFTGRLWTRFLYLTRGQYKKLQETLEQDIELFRKNAFIIGLFEFNILSAYSFLQTAQYSKALEMTHQALEAAYQIDYDTYKNLALHFRGLSYVRMERMTDAKNTAKNLKQMIEKTGYNNLLRRYYHLMGEIARAEGNIQEAINYFETALSLLPKEYSKFDTNILYLDSLAASYYENGELDKALKVYEEISVLKTGRLRWGDKYVRSFYWQGIIFQKKKENEKAVAAYKKFMELWSQANPQPRELLETQKLLEGLTTPPG